MLRLRTPITNDELLALQVLADQEMRDPGEQAHFIIRKELERRGLLQRESKLTYDTKDGQLTTST